MWDTAKLNPMERNKKRQALSTVLLFSGVLLFVVSSSFGDRAAVRLAGVVMAMLGCGLSIRFYLKSNTQSNSKP